MLSPIALDFETSWNGHGSTDYYKDGFRVDSIALTWRRDGALKSVFYDNPDVIKEALTRLAETERPVIVHNLQFEAGVMMNCYPDLDLNFQYDTMRMCFLRDGEGRLEKTDELSDFLKLQAKQSKGVGLEKCAKRYLPSEHHNHKAEAHTWIEDNLGVTSGHGSHLDKLPRDILERYNIADTEITYLLYEDCLKYFKDIEFNDRIDWQYYSMKQVLFAKSRTVGFPIDREGLLEYITEQDKKVQATHQELLDWCGAEDILKYEESRIWADIKKKVKLEKNWPKAFETRKASPKFKFNPNGPQLGEFLVQLKGMEPVVMTKGKKPKPSLAKADLWQWGEAGKIITNRGSMKLALDQAIGVYLASEFDGTWHPDIKPVPTATNRVKGGRDD